MKRLQIIMPDGAKFQGETMTQPQEQTETKQAAPRTVTAIAADLDVAHSHLRDAQDRIAQLDEEMDVAHAHLRDAQDRIAQLDEEMDVARKAGRRGLRKGR